MPTAAANAKDKLKTTDGEQGDAQPAVGGDKSAAPSGARRSAPGRENIFLECDSVSLAFPIYKRNIVNTGGGHNDFGEKRILKDKRGRVRAVQALKDVSFRLNQGDRLAIVGRNGSGKTTLLQVLAGLLPADSGKVSSHGKLTNLINIGLGLSGEASGYRNITLLGLAAGYKHEEIDKRRKDIAEFADLGDFIGMPVTTYSAGMRMRLSLAIATAFSPEILILDEWLSAGDSKFQIKVRERMRQFVDQAGILVLASHSRELILANCDKGLWLDDGMVRMSGPVKEVYEAYDSEMTG